MGAKAPAVRLGTTPPAPLAANKFLLEEIPSDAPDQTWYLCGQPIPASGGQHKVLLFVVQQPRHAGDDFRLRVTVATLHAPELNVGKANLATWMRHQVARERAQETVACRDATLVGAFQAVLLKTQARFLPAGSEFVLPKFTEEAARTRSVHLGFFIGSHEAHGVPCAACEVRFTSRIDDKMCMLTLRLAPDGPLTTLYWCPSCASPGLASAGILNLTAGRDGAILTG